MRCVCNDKINQPKVPVLKQPVNHPRGISPYSPCAEEEQLRYVLSQHLRRSLWRVGFCRVLVKVCREQVTLTGVVHSFHLKQIAQTLIHRASNGKPVVNDLSIVSNQPELHWHNNRRRSDLDH